MGYNYTRCIFTTVGGGGGVGVDPPDSEAPQPTMPDWISPFSPAKDLRQEN